MLIIFLTFKGAYEMYKKPLTPGDKLKELRKLLNLKQVDLTSPKISRPLISLYENNRTPINSDNLYYFYNIFEKESDNQEIELPYSFEEFSKSIQEQISDQAIQFSTLLKKTIDNNSSITVDNLENIKKFSLLERIHSEYKYLLFEAISDYYYYIDDPQTSFFYSEKAFDSVLYTETEDEKLRIANKILRKGIYLRKQNLYPYLDLLNKYIFSSNKDEILIYHYNRAIVYKLSGDYEKALSAINQIKEEWIKEDYKLDELVLFKANLNEDIGNYLESIKYLDILSKSDSLMYQVIAQLNKINIVLIHENRKSEGMDMFDVFLKTYPNYRRIIHEHHNRIYDASIYFYLSKFFHLSKIHQEAANLIKESLKKMTINTNIRTKEEIYKFGIELMNEMKNDILIEMLRKSIEESLNYDPHVFREVYKKILLLQTKY